MPSQPQVRYSEPDNRDWRGRSGSTPVDNRQHETNQYNRHDQSRSQISSNQGVKLQFWSLGLSLLCGFGPFISVLVMNHQLYLEANQWSRSLGYIFLKWPFYPCDFVYILFETERPCSCSYQSWGAMVSSEGYTFWQGSRLEDSKRVKIKIPFLPFMFQIHTATSIQYKYCSKLQNSPCAFWFPPFSPKSKPFL